MLKEDDILRDRYRIKEVIAQGGMSVVYRAQDQSLNKTVAVKEALETLTDDEAWRRGFRLEAERLASFRHPALPSVQDYFIVGSRSYLIMEFIEGADLGSRLAAGEHFTVKQVAEWADALLDALRHIHNASIIHRDIKPQNLKVTAEGQIILLDFGLAASVTGDLNTQTNLHGFTPRYASPEQLNGRTVDMRSDIYSLGATLYTLLSGTQIFSAQERLQAVSEGETDPLIPLIQINTEIPTYISAALARATALNPDDRFASASDMRRVLSTPPSSKHFSLHTLLTHLIGKRWWASKTASIPQADPAPFYETAPTILERPDSNVRGSSDRSAQQTASASSSSKERTVIELATVPPSLGKVILLLTAYTFLWIAAVLIYMSLPLLF